MKAPRPPAAEEQLTFLRSLQRLLDEGSFVSSYKFALLHAIADLCLLKGDDRGAELELSTSEIAEQFIRLYWPQAAPFVAGGHGQVLSQNTGRQAAVVRELAGRYDVCQGSLAELERSRSEWGDVRRMVEGDGQEDAPLEATDRRIRTPGVPVRERRRRSGRSARARGRVLFSGLLSDDRRHDRRSVVLLRPATQPKLLGQVVDLRSFLFGSRRSSLATYRPLLMDLQQGRCFYCERGINRGGDVDHFIPWRRYALDLGHNFVLAHQGCNSSKSDLLAAEEHLERWTERSLIYRDELEEGFDERKVLHDWPATRQIATWAYGQVHRAGGQVWVESKELRPLSDDWRKILSGADHAAA